MKSRITVLTLGVKDLEKSVHFYQSGLGLITPGIIGREFENGAVAFFDLENGLKLALWPKSSISADTNIPVVPASSLEFTIGHNVGTKEEVIEVLNEVSKAGGRIVKSAQDTFYGGFAGYFADPDDHLWEVVWNPQFELTGSFS
ncbi:VOC family protein [Flavitalea sp.]|nr:VOC family protein [Flavitalea sp.]